MSASDPSEIRCACQSPSPRPSAISRSTWRLCDPNFASAERVRPSTERNTQIALPGEAVPSPSRSRSTRCESQSGLKSTYR